MLHSFGKQRMIAIPLACSIQRVEEKVRLVELGKHLRAILPSSQGITQRAGEAIEQAGLQQKVLQGLWLSVEYIRYQVFENMLVAA